MIKSFADKRTKRFFEGELIPAFSGIASQAARRLRVVDGAGTLRTLQALPSNRFQALVGDRTGQYSVRINDQWRICFCWRAKEGAAGILDPLDHPGDAVAVEIVGYH